MIGGGNSEITVLPICSLRQIVNINLWANVGMSKIVSKIFRHFEYFSKKCLHISPWIVFFSPYLRVYLRWWAFIRLYSRMRRRPYATSPWHRPTAHLEGARELQQQEGALFPIGYVGNNLEDRRRPAPVFIRSACQNVKIQRLGRNILDILKYLKSEQNMRGKVFMSSINSKTHAKKWDCVFFWKK